MMALDYQLDYIVNKEGIDNRFKRHKILANYTPRQKNILSFLQKKNTLHKQLLLYNKNLDQRN